MSVESGRDRVDRARDGPEPGDAPNGPTAALQALAETLDSRSGGVAPRAPAWEGEGLAELGDVDGLLGQQQLHGPLQRLVVLAQQSASGVQRLVQQFASGGMHGIGERTQRALLGCHIGGAELAHAVLADHAAGELGGILEVVGGALGEVVAKVQLLGRPAGHRHDQLGSGLAAGQEHRVRGDEPGDPPGGAARHDGDLDRVLGVGLEQPGQGVAGLVPGGDGAVPLGHLDRTASGPKHHGGQRLLQVGQGDLVRAGADRGQRWLRVLSRSSWPLAAEEPARALPMASISSMNTIAHPRWAASVAVAWMVALAARRAARLVPFTPAVVVVAVLAAALARARWNNLRTRAAPTPT